MDFNPEALKESLIQFKVSEKKYLESIAVQEQKVKRLQEEVDQLPPEHDPLNVPSLVGELNLEQQKLTQLKAELEEIRIEMETLFKQLQQKPNPNIHAEQLLSELEGLVGKNSTEISQEKALNEMSLQDELAQLKQKMQKKDMEP